MDLTTDLSIVRERPDLFRWGKVSAIHTIGRFTIIEYVERTVLHFPLRTMFWAYVGNESINNAHASLEAALVSCIAHKTIHDPTNACHMAMAAMKILEIGF